MTILDAPRTYRIPGKWGWFFLLSDAEREDVCFGHPDVREELEELETQFYLEHDGFRYGRAVARVKELEEALEPVA